MMFWTVDIRSPFRRDLMGCGVTSQLLCPCLNTGAEENRFTSSSEVSDYASVKLIERKAVVAAFLVFQIIVSLILVVSSS